MIYIDLNTDRIVEARKSHFNSLSTLLENRFKKMTLTNYQKDFVKQMIIPNLKLILIGEPKEIFEFSNSIIISGTKKDVILKLFDYNRWFIQKTKNRYNSYELAKNLDINTCVYCNRNYTSTVDKVTRPQFDHYFPQVKYPLLALSFYNLIPSCSICNVNIKGEKELSLAKHLHPYISTKTKSFQFTYRFNNNMKGALEIKIKHFNNKKLKNTLEFFKIEQIYNAHNDELRDLIKIRDTFSDKYLEILSKSVLDGTNIGKSEMYQFAFGVYHDESKLLNRPFSKFKKDILKELGII